MALEPKLSICVKNACSTLVISETTGAYSATNVGGYGTPNPATGDVSAASLKIIAPDETEYTINLLTEGFPNTNSSFEYEIPSADVDDRTNIEDGYWQFIYTVTASGTDYIGTTSAILHCNISCCINKMLLNLDTDCDCDEQNTTKIQDYVKAKAFLDALRHYAYCGNLDKFDNIKLILDRLCAKTDCKTCN